MSFIEKIGSSLLEGGGEALRSLAELAVNRGAEIDSGVASMDIATQSIGLEPYTPASVSAYSEVVISQSDSQPEAVAGIDDSAVPSNVADLGAFRRLREAKAQVAQAHTNPTAQRDQAIPVEPTSIAVENVASLDPQAQERLNAAQRRIDELFNQAV